MRRKQTNFKSDFGKKALDQRQCRTQDTGHSTQHTQGDIKWFNFVLIFPFSLFFPTLHIFFRLYFHCLSFRHNVLSGHRGKLAFYRVIPSSIRVTSARTGCKFSTETRAGNVSDHTTKVLTFRRTSFPTSRTFYGPVSPCFIPSWNVRTTVRSCFPQSEFWSSEHPSPSYFAGCLFAAALCFGLLRFEICLFMSRMLFVAEQQYVCFRGAILRFCRIWIAIFERKTIFVNSNSRH